MDNSELTKECMMCGLRLNESSGCTHKNCPNNQGFTMDTAEERVKASNFIIKNAQHKDVGIQKTLISNTEELLIKYAQSHTNEVLDKLEADLKLLRPVTYMDGREYLDHEDVFEFIQDLKK